MNFRNSLFSFFLLLSAFAPIGTFSEPAWAQVAGTRYEITLNATKADLNTETRLVLFQQQ